MSEPLYVFFDTETYSATPIKNGTFRYAADCEVMLWAYAFGNGPVNVWDVTLGGPMPDDLRAAIDNPDAVWIAHNTMFDVNVINYYFGIDLSGRVIDTMVQALAHSLPGALGVLCEVLGVPPDDAKSQRGKELVQLFCKPRPKNHKLRRAHRLTHPAEWQEFKDYATSDIRAMRSIFGKMPSWNYSRPTHSDPSRYTPGEHEYRLWELDQRINRRGFLVDTDLAEKAITAVRIAQDSLGDRVAELTFDEVKKATQRDKLLRYILEAYGVYLPDMQKSTIERRQNDQDLPIEVRELISIRLEASMSSTSKYKALVKAVSDDHRLRGCLQFCGASRTGRDAGRTFQPQNLFRPTMKGAKIAEGIETIKAGRANEDLTKVIEMCANAVRGCIIASPGQHLVVSDLSNIEGRFAAWVANETWKIKAFSDFDKGIGFDLYALAYAKAFSTTPEEVMEDKKNGTGLKRQIGKVCLAEGTLVMVENGWLPIERVTTAHRVWDGEEWVSHQGLQDNGVRLVVNVAGIKLTPDHLILTGTTWTPAQQLVTSENMLYQALATGSASLPWLEKTLTATMSQVTSALLPKGLTYRTEGLSARCSKRSTNYEEKMRTYDLLNAGPRRRFTVLTSKGPIIVHNCELMLQYEGGVGAFITGAATYRIDLDQLAQVAWPNIPEETRQRALEFYKWSVSKNRSVFGLEMQPFVVCDSLKRMWRDAHPAITAIWQQLKEAFAMCISQPGQNFTVGRVILRRDGTWLRIVLPSGRVLCYPAPLMDEKGQLSYLGVNNYTRKWQRIKTYGGKLFENIVQAGSRDVFADAWMRVEDAGYNIVMRVHDELITEAPLFFGHDAKDLSRLMATQPVWAYGLPLAAGGFDGKRYKKGD